MKLLITPSTGGAAAGLAGSSSTTRWGGAGTTSSTGGAPPTFAQLDDDQLGAAVELAERMAAEGDPLVRALDAQSLTWQGKPAKR